MTGTAKVGTVMAVASASSVAAVFAPAAPWTAGLFEWLAQAGPAGVVIYAAVFAVAAVCLVPGSILTVGAGVAYGLVWGTLIAWNRQRRRGDGGLPRGADNRAPPRRTDGRRPIHGSPRSMPRSERTA